jgi:hypothetical protein
MTTLCFNSVEKDPWTNLGTDPSEQRITDVRTVILHYGVDPKYVFRAEDILRKRNTPKVIRCLEEVAKLVSSINSTVWLGWVGLGWVGLGLVWFGLVGWGWSGV